MRRFSGSRTLSNYLYLPQFHIVCLLAILVGQPCLSAILSNYLHASLQPCLSGCLLFFCDSSILLNYPNGSNPACSSACQFSMKAPKYLPASNPACISSRIALPWSCSTKRQVSHPACSSACNLLAACLLPCLPTCQVACNSSITALRQRFSSKISACLHSTFAVNCLQFFYDSLPQPFLLDYLPPHTLPAKLLVIILWQIYRTTEISGRERGTGTGIQHKLWRPEMLLMNRLEFSSVSRIFLYRVLKPE